MSKPDAISALDNTPLVSAVTRIIDCRRDLEREIEQSMENFVRRTGGVIPKVDVDYHYAHGPDGRVIGLNFVVKVKAVIP